MISVVVPSHNRAQSAVKLARAMASQRTSEPLEIIFALDGCTDDSRETLSALRLNVPIRIVELSGLGAAAARNRGAAGAKGDILLFIDDDILPLPGLINAHVAAHRKHGARTCVIGPCFFPPEASASALDFYAREWWHGRYRSLSDPTHKFTYRDCLTGNLSIARQDFEAVGGFDAMFRQDGREDYELGARLLKAGVSLRFSPDARTYHYATNRPMSTIRKWRTFGRADIHFIQKHPEVFSTLPVSRYWSIGWPARLALRMAAASFPVEADTLISFFGSFFERNLDRMWDHRLLALWNKCRDFAYFLGAASAVGGVRRLEEFVREHRDESADAGCRVSIEDMDIACSSREIGADPRHDRTLLLATPRGVASTWVDVPRRAGSEPIISEQVSSIVPDQAAWELWCSSSVGDVTGSSRDSLAWEEFRKWTAGLGWGLGGRTVRPNARAAGLDVLVFGGEDTWSLIDKGRSEAVMLLEASDRMDSVVTELVSRLFAQPGIDCVILPVVLRNVRTRGEELYNSLAGLDRVTSWGRCELSRRRFHPGYVLHRFRMGSHRIAVRRSALRRIGVPGSDLERAATEIVVELLFGGNNVVYEPNAPIWADASPSMNEVRSMACESMRQTCESLSADRRVAGVAVFMYLQARRVVKSLIRPNKWPLSLAVAESRAAVAGLARGIFSQRTRNGTVLGRDNISGPSVDSKD